MIKTLSSTFLLCALMSPAVARGATSAVAYVSMQKIAAESTEAKTGAAKLETMRQEKARAIAAKREALEATHLQLVQAGGLFQRSRRVQLQAEENRQRTELQRLTEQSQADLQNLQRQLQNSLRQKISTILDRLTKQKGVQLVLNADTSVVWAAPGIDLTQEVLSSLNATEEQAKKK